MIILNRSSEKSINPSRYKGAVDLLRRNEDVIEIIVHQLANASIDKLS